MSALTDVYTYTERDRNIEKSIIDYLKQQKPSKVEIGILIKDLENHYDNFEIRENMWHLINKGDVILTEDRKLKYRNNSQK